MDRLKPVIDKEWLENEYVEPCFYKSESKADYFQSYKYPHYCFHKAKKTLPMRLLED